MRLMKFKTKKQTDLKDPTRINKICVSKLDNICHASRGSYPKLSKALSSMFFLVYLLGMLNFKALGRI